MQPPALQQLHTALRRALADPDINTGPKRAERLRTTVATLERAAADLPEEALRTLPALFHNDVLGHPNHPDTVLARVAAGQYRTRPPYGKPLASASQRYLMDGIVDLNRAARRRPFWWEVPGARPWSKHTRVPLDPRQHIGLRRALSTPVHPWREPFRLRLLAALEVLWATGITREGLVAANVRDLTDDRSTIRVTRNPPGRTEATEEIITLSASARAALYLWLPVRDAVVDEHLREGSEHEANDALFVTLRHTTGVYPDGTPRQVPPGLRITGNGLEINYSQWARRLNGEHVGQKGWPVPTDLYRIARGGQLAAEEAERTRA
jgi:integrase